MQSLNTKIGFAGDGWGAIAAVKSLVKKFKVEFLTQDPNVKRELLLENKSQEVQSFNEFSSKIIVCSGYKPIIKREYLEKYTIINIHYSLLPKYRGLHSTAWAIINDEKELGLSIHIMNEFIDDGPIIFQKRIKNDGESKAVFYMEYFNTFIENNLSNILISFIEGKIKPAKQNKKLASWVGKRTVRHNLINFNENFKFIKNQLRILTPPYPLPCIKYSGQYYQVKKVDFFYNNINTDIGRILNVDNEGVWVKSKEGYVILSQILDSKENKVSKTIFKIGRFLDGY